MPLRWRIWRGRRKARLLSRYEKDTNVAALVYVGKEKYTVGVFRAGREVGGR